MALSPRLRSLSFVFCILCLVFSILCLPSFAVLGVPIANMKHAEKFEKAGRFARAAEERELAAEFYYWISVPQYEEYLAYYQARNNTGKIAESEKWLRDFEQWIATCRDKAKEDWEKVQPTPARREKSRRRVEIRMIASADLYPMMHHGMLGLELSVLERKAKYPEQFEVIAEARERTARLYDAMGVRYSLHAAQRWEEDGKTEDAERMRAQVDRYQKLIQHNRKLAEEARQRAKEVQQWNDLEYLNRLLYGDDIKRARTALKRLGMLDQRSALRRALKHPQSEIQQQALELLIEKHDLLGLWWTQAAQGVTRAQANDALSQIPLTAEAMKPVVLVNALSEPEGDIRVFAQKALRQMLGEGISLEKDELLRYLLTTSLLQQGLQGVYYRGKSFDTEHSLRVDKQVNFQWSESPVEDVASENLFSARWIGWLRLPEADEYELLVQNDDGARLWVDGKLIVDDWNDHAPTIHGKRISLEEGLHSILLEYYNNKNKGVIRLLWKQDEKLQPIPAEWLWHIQVVPNVDL